MEKEIDIFQMYLREMAAIESCDETENARLVQAVLAGDGAAKSRLVEGNLKYVLEISRDYIGKGLPAGDLVQEANVALMLAVEELSAMEDSFEQFVTARVKDMLNAAVDQQESENRIGQHMADRVNLLQDVSKDMADELGREPKVDELAKRLQMTEEEIKDIMKVALDAINILGE